MKIRIKKFLGVSMYGLIFGFLSPVPGVSAGTVAILLNVYDKFFSSINREYAKKNFVSIIIFLLGWGAGLLSISRAMMFLFDNHGKIISFAFIGLISGCVPMIYKKATVDTVKTRNVAISVAAFVFMCFLAFYGNDLTANNTIEQFGGLTPALLAWIFFASFVSSMAMLIPGVGGSLMMIVFGIYTIYIESVSTLNPVLLVVFLVSMVFGVFAGIVVTKKMLDHFSQTLYFAILGFIIGSLLILFPGFYLNLDGLLSIVKGVLCFAFAYWLSGKEKTE